MGLIHGICLGRWLQTSQRNTCELCLTPFRVPGVRCVSGDGGDVSKGESDGPCPRTEDLALWLVIHVLVTVLFVCLAVEAGVRAAMELRREPGIVSTAVVIKMVLAFVVFAVSVLLLHKGAWRAYVRCWFLLGGGRVCGQSQ